MPIQRVAQSCRSFGLTIVGEPPPKWIALTLRRSGGHLASKPDLLFERIEIGGDRVVAAHLLGMAAAIETEPIAERDVQVERQRGLPTAGQAIPDRRLRRRRRGSAELWGSWLRGTGAA